MGLKRTPRAGLYLTAIKLEDLILEFLTDNAVHLQDYQPESELWRQQLAAHLAAFIKFRTDSKTP